MLRLIICFFLLLSSLISFAQDRCGTVEYERLLHQKSQKKETIDQFELWMKSKVAQKQKTFQAGKIESTNYVVPVVVHVINNGEAVGSGSNISDAQIMSQITVLNNDFQRLNADTVKTLSEFVPVAGKFNVTFVLAKQDPDGLTTSGIVRVKGTKGSWGISDNYAIKAQSYWPAEDYLNIWVVNLSGGLLGYTQLPVSSTLQGLEDSSNDRLTDGIVIDYQTFGTVQDPNGSQFNLLSEYNLGRTVTHEVGHFFGLRHVWGDVTSCNPSISTDYVADTPVQDTNYNGTCPSVAQSDCNHSTMFANYMNYTDDACMNIFSKGQVTRMDIVINNSPRRASLLTSIGSLAPAPVANDIWLKTLLTPGTTTCSGNISPSLLVRNFGSTSITSSQIQFSLNGNLIEAPTFPLSLAPNTETAVSFSQVLMNAGSTYKFSFQVLNTNGGTDGKFYNDTLSITSQVPAPVALPLIEPFNQTPSNWSIVNPDGESTWKNMVVENSNKAMYIDFYNYDNQGSTDWLITPVLDLTSSSVASISFDYAYSAFSGSNDRLRILVSTSCDFLSSPVEVFNKSGTNLATTTKYYGSEFKPLAAEWVTKIISLNQFIGQKIQIAFVGTNDYGNDLYIDNVTVFNSPISAFEINDFVSPSPVSCLSSVSPVLSIKNLGNTMIDSFTANLYVNGQLTTQQISNAQIDVGSSKNITLSPINFSNGNNTISTVIKYPNGVSSGQLIKDSLVTKRVINTSTDFVPLLENFDHNSNLWSTVNPGFGAIWYQTYTNKSVSMEYDAFTNTNLGEKAWLVSPVLDFSKLDSTSVTFETSYGYHSTGSETLQVFSSTDCGVNFDQLLFTASGEEMNNSSSSKSWLPSSDGDWTSNHINLQALAGKENVRLAFVVTNANGNNLYLDNVEFFAEVAPPKVDGIYSVYGGLGEPVKISFKLPERQLVRLQVFDFMGKVVRDDLLPDTINQTYTLDDDKHYQSRGVYIVRVQTQSPASVTSTKVFFGF